MRLRLAVLLVGAVSGSASVVFGQQPNWTIDPTPRVELGTSIDDPRDQFGRIVDVAFGPRGEIVVLDGTPPAVRRFAADGSPLRDFGRAGDGPGEFRAPVALAVVGDTIVVLGGDGRRGVFGPGGAVARDERLEMASVCGAAWNPRAGGLLTDGSVVVRCLERLFGRVRGEYRQTVGLLRVAPGLARVDTLGWFPADTGRTDDGDPPIPRPYAPRAELLAVDGDGRVFVATSDRPTVRAVRFDGSAIEPFELPVDSRPVTEADLARHVESMLRVGGSANDQRVIREWAEEMPSAERTPVIRSLVAAASGELWVETWDDDAEGVRWLVVGGDGTLLSEVRAPPGADIRAVSDDAVLAVWRDAFGVERVRLYPLLRSRRSGG
ncbi:MAG: hypothetical protein HKO98_02505 [Gemmatimonadetes bacterium]|nr:hypothetical protein [Gemmatimonadota bacterium]